MLYDRCLFSRKLRHWYTNTTRLWPLTTFDASNRVSKLHVKIGKTAANVLHETFITSGAGCARHPATRRAHVCVICLIVSVTLYERVSRFRANINFNLESLHSIPSQWNRMYRFYEIIQTRSHWDHKVKLFSKIRR